MTPFEELALITARIQRARIIDPCDRAEDDRDLKALDEAIERAEKFEARRAAEIRDGRKFCIGDAAS